MDRTSTIRRLAASFVGAAATRDWDLLDLHVRGLPAALEALAADGAWSGEERAALAELRVAHEQAANACAGALQLLQSRLDEMSSNKEGWMAYALDSEAALAENP